MSKKNDNSFASSAGLMRYFDTEDDRGVRISPKTVIGLALGFSIVVILATIFFPMN